MYVCVENKGINIQMCVWFPVSVVSFFLKKKRKI